MFLLHLFLLGEGKRAASCSPPIRGPGCSGAPRLALRVNELYPEILAPPLLLSSPFLTIFFSFTICLLLFLPLLLFLLCYSSQLFSLSLHPSLYLIILSTGASENKLSSGLPMRASATWRSLKVHVPNSLLYFFLLSITISQLCCVRRNLGLLFAGCFHEFLRVRNQVDDHIHVPCPENTIYHPPSASL